MDIPLRASDAGPDNGHRHFTSQEDEDDYLECQRLLREANWPQCGNCWKACEELIYVPGHDYMGCPECALEAVTLDAAELSEWFCPERFETVQKAETVYGLVDLLNAHNAQCVACGGGRKQAGVEVAGGPIAVKEIA